jgi:hypothetical protein
MTSVEVVVDVVVGDTVVVISMVVVAVAPVVVMTWVVGVTISEQAFEIRERANLAKTTCVKIVVEMIYNQGWRHPVLRGRGERAWLLRLW